MVNSNPYNNQNASFIPRSVSKSHNLYFLEFMLIIFFFAYYLLPAVASAVPFMVALFIGIGYLAYLFVREPFWRVPIGVFLFLCIGISLLYFFFTDKTLIATSVSNYEFKRISSKINEYFMMFFPVCMFVRIYTKASERQKKLLYLIAVITFSFVIINTFVELMTNERAVRDWSGFSENNENNIGTYAYVYAVPMVVTALTSLLYGRRGISKIAVIGIIIFLFVFLLAAQYTLALLATIIGIALQISANIKNVGLKLLLWLLFLGILLILPTLLEFFADTIQSEDIAIRFRELASFFGGGDASGYNLNGRMELYGKSIQAFFKSPLIGNRNVGFDGHATFLSVPADIGVFGLFAILILVIKSKKYTSALMGEKQRQFTPVFACLIIMGLTNPIHGATTALFATWLLAPMILKTHR
ncbi:MAG: hypothetical protein J6B45_05615 [Clostridia bacterium]|nr:hypothetical protein [Clostridia bacterium]